MLDEKVISKVKGSDGKTFVVTRQIEETFDESALLSLRSSLVFQQGDIKRQMEQMSVSFKALELRVLDCDQMLEDLKTTIPSVPTLADPVLPQSKPAKVV